MYVLALVEGLVSRDRILTWVSSLVYGLVRPNLTRFFGLNPILDQKFGLSRVGLASNRVQIRVQPYNVHNKPE